MTDVATKATLTPARKRLIELMQEINYGPNASCCNDGFALKKKVAELFEVFDRERSLSIQELVIDNGLPVRMTVADAVRA